MTEIQSNYYVKYFEGTLDRLDFVFHHPKYDQLKKVLKSNKFVNLGELILPNSIHQGLMISGKEKGKVPFISIENLKRDGTIDLSNLKYVDQAPAWRLLKIEDILFSRSRLIGICAVVSKDCIDSICGSYIFFFQINKAKILPKFLSRFINSLIGRTQIEYIQTGSSGNNINIEETKTIRILLPSTIQQQIILDSVHKIEDLIPMIDEKIARIKDEIDKIMLSELKVSVLSSHESYFFRTGKDERSPYFFTKFDRVDDRLDYLHYDPTLSLIDYLKNICSTTTLGKITTVPIIRGEQPDYTDAKGQAITMNVIKTVNLKDGYIDYDNCLKVTGDFFENHKPAQVHNGDVLISSTGYVSMGKIDVYDKKNAALVDGHVAIVRCKEGYDPYFIAYFLRSHLGKQQFEKWWTGSSGQIELQPTDLKNFIIPDNTERGVPANRQIMIATKITSKLNEIKKFEKQKEKLITKAEDEFAEITEKLL